MTFIARVPRKARLVMAMLAAAALSGGCAAPRGPLIGAAVPGVSSHVWREHRTAGDEPPGFATYTYVLVNRRCVTDPTTWGRYRELVNAITGSTLQEGDLPPLDRSTANLFLVPIVPESATATSSTGTALLNDVLAIRTLHAISRAVEDAELRTRISTNPGPFLVTTTRPVSRMSAASPVLYVDLSTSHPQAMREVVTAYKRWVMSSDMPGIDRFTSFRISLLERALILNDNVTLVRSAAASILNGTELPTGGPSGACGTVNL